MARINVYTYDEYDGKKLAGWFSEDKAERFAEDTDWNGSNHISVVTGSQWEHEELYRTANGRWVLGGYSDRQGTLPTYEFVSDDTAKTWLAQNGHDDAIKKYFGELEEERGPGRPTIGEPVNIRFPEDVLTALDKRATTDGVSRAELVRRLVTAGLTEKAA